MRPRAPRAGLLALAAAAALALAAGALLPGCRPRSPDDARPTEARPADAPPDTPAWLTELIQRLEREPVANPPASIVRYRYKGQTVYYLPPRCCDVPSNLYDADGRVLCHPDGGITGSGDGRCPDFLTERTDEHLVWRDPRQR